MALLACHTRLEVIAEGIENAGFSKEVASRVTRGELRATLTRVYDGRWKFFDGWCSKHHVNHWKASTQQIADFLLQLFNGGKLKVRTIEGYRDAISSSLKLRGRMVGTDPHLSGLIASFYTDRPVELNLIPQWDLLVILDALTKHPFHSKDMSSIQLKHLTYKIVLLSLALGGRRGEIHALNITRMRWSDKGYEVVLRPYGEFLSKTYIARDRSSALTGCRIKYLAKGLERSDPDRILCPVRALKFYLKRAEPLHYRDKSLFIPLRQGVAKGKLSPNTISAG